MELDVSDEGNVLCNNINSFCIDMECCNIGIVQYTHSQYRIYELDNKTRNEIKDVQIDSPEPTQKKDLKGGEDESKGEGEGSRTIVSQRQNV